MSNAALSAFSEDALATLMRDLDVAPWRAQQVRHAAWQPYITGFGDIKQLPAKLQAALAEHCDFLALRLSHQQESDAGKTLKLLCRLHDDQQIETVIMETPATGKSARRATVCVSTQVGCAVGCPFCATGRLGLRRSCTAAEVIDQVRLGNQLLYQRGYGRITHVVYMGMGEPLHAFETTMDSLRTLAGPGKISPRRITVSTSGVVPNIYKLADSGIDCTLAISLHAAEDQLRDKLVPLNRRHKIDELIEAANYYRTKTGRRVSLEWCLIGGINDSAEQAEKLRALALQARAHVNVIPMNKIGGSAWGPPDPDVARRFLAGLRGTALTVRQRRGADTDAACGQLRAQLDDRRFLSPDGTLAPPVKLATKS